MMRIGLAVAIGLAILVWRGSAETLPQDTGAAGTWQKLQKLRTTASLMHTTAHPDDEHGGMLAMASRGEGARVSLVTLNRGEAGDNAIGPELFDALGLIRTEELLVADRYYGVDRQYFTTVIDYGFSKRLEEALDKWGREHVLRDVVRVIRMERPFVIVSRFQGNQRDGHGNHQTAGLITQDAWKVAGDPATFPEQIADGLRPWQPLKLYMGGVRENEDWTLRIDTGEYSPVLGDSFNNFARLGLSFQRSQNSGRFTPQPGPSVAYYKLLQSRAKPPGDAGTKEKTFFDGIDTRLQGLPALVGAHPATTRHFATIDRELAAAIEAFTMQDPAASAPALARGLAATREAMTASKNEPELLFVLRLKEQQISDAINTALGLELSAVAQPGAAGEQAAQASPFAPPALLGPVVNLQEFEVRASLTNRSRTPITLTFSGLEARPGFQFTPRDAAGAALVLNYNDTAERRFDVMVIPRDARPTRNYFTRDDIRKNQYTILDPHALHTPTGHAPPTAVVRYTIENVPVQLRSVVRAREAQLPYGYAMREVKIAPVAAVNVRPRHVIVPLGATARSVAVTVELLHNGFQPTRGNLALTLPPGWKASPAQAPVTFTRTGEKQQFTFKVAMPPLENREYRIDAVATIDGDPFREGYDVIEKRDLETRWLWRPAAIAVRGVDVKIAPGLHVGYVMGVGDEVPAGIAQLGAKVTQLGEEDLASGNLRQYDAIVTGTRAYAVRADLRTWNQRLLDYARDGGNLVVLYNTQELDVKKFAPFPGELTARAEEVSEEDSPVDILAPSHHVLRTPNAITKADFDGWVEQRGSKFWSAWDKAYTPIIATWDTGQAPQQGGWLHARHGKGQYTYFAYAFHRQLPYGVPGAYRILANLLSLGKAAPAAPAAAPPKPTSPR